MKLLTPPLPLPYKGGETTLPLPLPEWRGVPCDFTLWRQRLPTPLRGGVAEGQGGVELGSVSIDFLSVPDNDATT